MYTLLITDFVSRKCSRRAFFRSAPINVCTFLVVFSRNTVPVGFCCGGFSSTAGYVPGNEAYYRSNKRHSSFWLYLSKKRYSFLSEQLRKVFQLFFSKPFGFDSRRNNKSVPSVFVLKQSVTALFAFPWIGQNTVMF